MNSELLYILGLVVVVAISVLLACCFTESKGANTPYARRKNTPKPHQDVVQNTKSDADVESKGDEVTHQSNLLL